MWLCWHVGTVADGKLGVVAQRAGVPRHLVIAVWALLLETAAEAKPAGSIESLDTEGAAFSLETSEENLVAVLKAMEGKNLIAGCSLTNWSKRNHGKSTERVKAFRDRERRDETTETLHAVSGTQGNAPSVSETPTGHDSTDITTQTKKTEGEDAPPLAPPLAPVSIVQLPAKRAPKRTPLVKWDIQEGDDHVAYARSLGMNNEAITAECEKFENHHKAVGSMMADWGAAWKKWCRNWQTYAPRRAG